MCDPSPFPCFNDRVEDGRLLGQCVHRSTPADGVWKMAPEHYRALEDARAKYEALVAYARRRHTYVLARERYPTETAALASREGDWQHGFNSGMLAAMRLVTAMLVREQGSVERVQAGNATGAASSSCEGDCGEGDGDGENANADEVDEALCALNDFPFLDT